MVNIGSHFGSYCHCCHVFTTLYLFEKERHSCLVWMSSCEWAAHTLLYLPLSCRILWLLCCTCSFNYSLKEEDFLLSYQVTFKAVNHTLVDYSRFLSLEDDKSYLTQSVWVPLQNSLTLGFSSTLPCCKKLFNGVLRNAFPQKESNSTDICKCVSDNLCKSFHNIKDKPLLIEQYTMQHTCNHETIPSLDLKATFLSPLP